MSKYVFLINPKSGVSKKLHLPKLIEESAKRHNKDFEILHWENADDAKEKTKRAVSENAFAVIGAGGDGTVNVLAQNLLHTNTAVGIIPVGSGNGLARHLKIPLRAEQAIEKIFTGNILTIDTGKLNDQLFLSNCGVGFLADVIHSFQHSQFRGLPAYALHTFKRFFDSQNLHLKIKIENEEMNDEFFFISICNANQFGYEVKLAPDASLHDGLLEFYFVPKISSVRKIHLLTKVLREKSYQFSQSKLLKAESAEIFFEGKIKAQIDGDAIMLSSPTKIQIKKNSLKVIV